VTGAILLVRHGETEWNLARRIQGRFDSPLTERGVAQARAIGRLVRALPNARSARIVTSPLGRAMRTAQIIAEHLPTGCELVTDARLREISAGSWDGLTFRDIELRCPGIFDGEGRYEWNFRAPGGESYEGFAARIGEWLRDLVDAPLSIAVSHGVVSRVMRGLYADLPRDVALTLPVPQDRVFLLASGFIEELRVPVPGAADRAGRLRDAANRGRSA
jgi:broad specificity phosphatase PhoE